MEEKKHGDLEVLKWFKTYVIGSKTEPSVGHQELVSDFYCLSTCVVYWILLLYGLALP